MRLLNLIIDAYLESKARKRAVKDWQNTGTMTADWYRRYSKREVVGKTTFSFFENGLRQRKVKFYSTNDLCEGKEHELYRIRIKPWLDGANFPDLPPFREIPDYLLNFRKKDEKIQEDVEVYDRLLENERNEPLNNPPESIESADTEKNETALTYAESFQPSERWKIRDEGSTLPCLTNNHLKSGRPLMKILSAITSFFGLLAEQHMRKKDWQVVGVCPCTWSESGVEKGRLSYTLFENGLRQRKVKMSSTLSDDPKTHRFYSLAVFPWLQGATIKGLPNFRGTEDNEMEATSILPPLTIKKKVNSGPKAQVRKSASAVRIGNNVLQVDFANKNRK